MLAGYDAEGVAEIMGMGAGQTAAAVDSGFREDHPTFVGKMVETSAAPSGNTWSSFSSLTIEQAIERGLPREALRHLAERMAGGDRSRTSALECAIVPKTTLERRRARLSPSESERTERVARLFVHARRALGSESEARVFMLAPHPELEGRTPLEAARTDLATRRVEHLLEALEYGLVI